MKKYLLITLIPLALLLGAGCNNTPPQQSADTAPQTTSNNSSIPQTVTPTAENNSQTPAPDNSNKTPRQRGVVRVYVVSAKNKLPVPGATIVVAHSSENKTTNADGWVEFPAATGNIYIPKMNGFKGSAQISTAEGNKEGTITIVLQPEK